MTESLDHCRVELDKERQLTEKLENDLLQVDSHRDSAHPLANGDRHSGVATPSNSIGLGLNTAQDGLSGLRLGEKSMVRELKVEATHWLNSYPALVGLASEGIPRNWRSYARYFHFTHCNQPARSLQTT